MKLQITQLKAPWPQGAAVGDVVDVEGDKVPGWAQGKCVQVGDDVEAAFYVDGGPKRELIQVDPQELRAEFERLHAQHAEHVKDLQARATDAEGLRKLCDEATAELLTAKEGKAALDAQVADLQSQLHAANTAKDALQAELDKAAAKKK